MPRAYRGVRGPNRSVEVKLKSGKQFENFYWMEGPLEEDQGCRITVLHHGQEQQCSHCLIRGNCPANGNGKACRILGTQRGKISDYMKYKQKQEMEFPTLSKKKTVVDSFGHMVEEEDSLDDGLDPIVPENKNDEATFLKVDPDDFVYDAKNDTIVPKNVDAFENLVEHHPSLNKLKRDNKRDEKDAKLKGKVLDTVKVVERKKRNLSCDSVKSWTSDWGSTSDREKSSERGSTRPRSEDSDPEHHKPNKTLRKSRAVLLPPKIIVSK